MALQNAKIIPRDSEKNLPERAKILVRATMLITDNCSLIGCAMGIQRFWTFPGSMRLGGLAMRVGKVERRSYGGMDATRMSHRTTRWDWFPDEVYGASVTGVDSG